MTQKAAKGVSDASISAARGVSKVTKKTASKVSRMGSGAFKKVYGLIDDDSDS